MRSASGDLKTIASAQADFRANDRDGNGRTDYWRGDVAGLYTLKNQGQEIKLIELSVAMADDRPVGDLGPYGTPVPRHGFKIRAIRHADETARGPDRFAACEFPSPIEKGRHGTYLISESNVVYKRILGHDRGVEAHPTEEELKSQAWDSLD
ncbi:MAG: hypothetical protein HY293_17340 [Planctomycetes bacterium]|nr:hypothetical protein [Planctomycetota bacterium]